MPEDDHDDTSADEGDGNERFSSFVDELEGDDEGTLDFGADDESSAGVHGESIFDVDDELSGRESWLDHSPTLTDTEARVAFAEEIAAQQLVIDGPPFVDADPGSLDAAAGLAVEGSVELPPGGGVDVMRRHLRGLLEALLFVSDRPMKVADLADVARADSKECRAILEELSAHYRDESRGFQLDELAGGWQLRTSATFAPFVRELTAQKPVRLTRAQVETLAIVAYRQPITRPEIEDVRGVDGGAVLKLLLDRDLVRVLGKKDEPGRPLLYGTTTNFLQFFGLKSLRDLPTLREFAELSDESKEVFERELGEVLPEVDTKTIGDAKVAAVDFDPEAPVTENAQTQAHEQAQEPPEAPPPAGGASNDPADEAPHRDDDDEDFDEAEDEDDANEDPEDSEGDEPEEAE